MRHHHRHSHLHMRKRPILVRCSKCGDVDEKKVKVLNIEEDFQGRDVLTFECPKCGETRKSLRFG